LPELHAEPNVDGIAHQRRPARTDRVGEPEGKPRMSLDAADRPSRMDRDAFVARFGQIFEHSPWIPAAAWDRGLGADADTAVGLHARLCAVLREASADRQLELIRAHPDLAGKLAQAKRLTEDSTREQASTA
jgi:2-oxo-4-hydroxy-4-carboxy--5-ureidoimidazoline (OHCU) decarboxylase